MLEVNSAHGLGYDDILYLMATIITCIQTITSEVNKKIMIIQLGFVTSSVFINGIIFKLV